VVVGKLKAPQELLDPNESSIAFKRRKFRELITTLPSFTSYVAACDSSLNT
jgi:hypothetical protein